MDINVGTLTGRLADAPRMISFPSGDMLAILRVGTELYFDKRENKMVRTFVNVRVEDIGTRKMGSWCADHKRGDFVVIKYRVRENIYELTKGERAGIKIRETVLDAQDIVWETRVKPQIRIDEDNNFGFGGEDVSDQEEYKDSGVEGFTF